MHGYRLQFSSTDISEDNERQEYVIWTGEGKVLFEFKSVIIICRQMFLPLNYDLLASWFNLMKPFLKPKCWVGFYLFY